MARNLDERLMGAAGRAMAMMGRPVAALRARPWAIAVLVLLLGEFFLLATPPDRGLEGLPRTVSVLEDRGERSTPPAAAAGGGELEWRAVRAPSTSAWLHAELDPPARLRAAEVLALEISGPFSAEIYWNGVLVGRKGRVGAERNAERAGPIDRVAAIPAALIAPGANALDIRYSSHHAGYAPSALFQRVALTEFRADDRRPLRHYAVALGLTGALAALAVGLAAASAARSRPVLLLLAASSAALVLAFAAEVSRSVVNYGYDWHMWRQGAVSLFLIAHGGCLFGAAVAAERFAVWRRPRLLATAICAALFVFATARGFDDKTAYVLAVVYCAAALAAVLEGRHAPRWRFLAAALGLAALYALFDPNDFIDRGVYLWGAAFFALALAFGTALFADRVDASDAAAALRKRPRIEVSHGGRTSYLDPADIVSLKAAGNYTELATREGELRLASGGIGELLDALPPNFVRVHRSHAVNLDFAGALRSAAGSRYSLALSVGEPVPVSRRRAAELRRLLSGADGETAPG